MAYRNYAPANGFIVSPDGTGDFTTIGSAITAAVSGVTIFLKPGTYTENPALKTGVNLVAFTGDDNEANVIISGKCTYSSAGTVSICNIRLQTNSDYAIEVTGSVASIVNIVDCYINCTNNTGIHFTSSSGSAQINIYNSEGDLGTTGIGLFTLASSGAMYIIDSDYTNTGGSSTASTISSGSVNVYRSFIRNPITSSSTGFIGYNQSHLDTGGQNVTCITANGAAGSGANTSIFNSGTAQCVTVTSTFNLINCTINSTNANVVGGAGTVSYTPMQFATNSNVNTTSQTPLNIGPKILAAGGIGFDGTNYLANYVAPASFTPVLKFGGATTGITYTTQVGRYQRIGGVITFSIDILLSSKGSASGAATVTGLPVAAVSGPNYDFVCSLQAWTANAANTYYIAVLGSGGSGFALYEQNPIVPTLTALADTNAANASLVRIVGSYFCA